METKQIVEAARASFLKDQRVQLAIVFGSRASGKATASSDLDVAVAYDHVLSLDEKIAAAQQLSLLIRCEVDLIDLLTARGVLLQQILKSRITLVNRNPELYGNLISRQVTDEADFMPLYDAMLKARRDRFIHGR